MPQIEVEDSTNCVIIDHPSNCASVTVALKGATITSWKMFSNDLLYLSPLADTTIQNITKPIRGGIPICWPAFGSPPKQYPNLPKHGFARQKLWTYLGSSVDENEDISASFELTHDDETLAMWPFQFTLQLQILLGMSYLQTSIKITNLESAETMPCQLLFHTYLRTDNIQQSVVTGLKGFAFTDQVLNEENTDRSAILPIVGEVDRIYRRHVYDEQALRFRNEELIALGDGGNCDITLRAIDLKDCVVWNPSATKPLSDLPVDGYKDFVCVELGTVSENINIKAGESFIGGQRLVLRILSKMSEQIRQKHALQANELGKTIAEEEAAKRTIQKILPAKSTQEAAPAAAAAKDEDDAKDATPDGPA